LNRLLGQSGFLSSKTAARPPPLVAALAAIVAKRLSKLASLKPIVEGVTISIETLGRGLAEEAAKLRATNTATNREKKEAEGTLVVKQREVARHATLFRGSASGIEGLARIAGQDELAERVRPSPIKPGVTEAEPGSDAPTPGPATPKNGLQGTHSPQKRLLTPN